MDAAVVVVGDELLAGHTVDANGPFLAKRLNELGHSLVRVTIVPDDEDTIVEALEDAARRASLVCVCGGLGPTHDDVTIDAVARFLGVPLESPPQARAQIERIYRLGVERGYLKTATVDDGAWRMARVPKGATVITNDQGVAPGSLSTTGPQGRRVAVLVLPGPPRELESVFGHAVTMGVLPSAVPFRTVEVHLRTFEAPIAGRLTEIDAAHPLVKIGSYPQASEVRVIVRIAGPPDAVEACAADVRRAFQDLVIPARAGQH